MEPLPDVRIPFSLGVLTAVNQRKIKELSYLKAVLDGHLSVSEVSVRQKTLKDFVRDQAPDLSETLKPKPDRDGVLRLPPMSTLENDDFWRIHAKTINPKHLYREDSET